MRPGRAGAVAGAGALTVGGAAIAYMRLLRERCNNWGATEEEIERRMPGDELVPEPDMLANRAIAIEAPPSAIWPWLVQMGSGRGGAYTYDWIENLFGLDMHSADEILPEHQDLALGDVVPLGPNGPGMRVERLEPERAMSWRHEDGNWVWTFGLYPEGGATRLVSRNRIALPGDSAARRLFTTLFMEPGSLVMERKMLLGIKERAERGTGARK